MRIGSLFSGYSGLDMAVCQHYGAEVAWFCEFDKHPSAILDAHYPDIPNYGDVTAVDWSAVEPVDIITGGYPCQPFSHAGHRRGTNDERHLWPYVADALRVLRPRLAVFENVAGHLTLGFDTVLADLAAVGFDADWGVVSAAEAGAPHRRQRLFIVATDADNGRRGQRLRADIGGAAVAGDGGGSRAQDGDLTLLPTPAVNDMGRGKTVEDWGAWTDAMRARHGNGNGHGKSLEIEAQRLLPTPKAQAAKHGSTTDITANGYGSNLWDLPTLLPTPAARDHKDQYVDNAGSHRPGDTDNVPRAVREMGTDFGPYAAAIARWEQVLGRAAPSPTEPGKDGRPRLSPAFVEWMMGLPDGWVTGVGIPRSAQLKALGNGVVPQQSALALALIDGAEVAS